MIYLPQGFTNNENLLSFYVVNDNGFLVDPHTIGFMILDPTGAQVYPIKPNAFAQLEKGGLGYAGVGRYFAVDVLCKKGWAPSSNAAIGTWSIRWQCKIKAQDSLFTWEGKFDVVASRDSGAGTGFIGNSYRTLISPQQARDQGLTTSDIDDAKLEQLIVQMQAYIERETRNFFRPIFDAVRVDGGGTGKLMFGLPIIGVADVYANDTDSQSSTSHESLAVAFAPIDRNQPFTPKPDYRRLPSISFVSSTSVFGGPSIYGGGVFRPGRLNQRIDAVWGFVESDGSVPQLIQEAALRLVFANADPLEAGGGQTVLGPLKGRVVDRHSEAYGEVNGKGFDSNLKRSLATSKKVEEILMFFKAPIAMSAPKPKRGSFRF